MHKKIFSAMYALNIFFQGFFSLVFPIALGAAASWLLVEYAGAPEWVYAPFTVLGVGAGFYSMIKFILTASRSLEHLEAEQKEKIKKKSNISGNNK